ITYFVGAFTEAEKAQEFLGDIKEEVKDNDLDLISAMIVANYNDGTESYIKKQPLFEQSYTSSKVSLTVKFYALVEKNYNKKSNSLYILIKDLNLNVDDLKQDDYGDDIIKANIEFNQVVTIGQTSKSDFNESFATLYDNKTKAFIIP